MDGGRSIRYSLVSLPNEYIFHVCMYPLDQVMGSRVEVMASVTSTAYLHCEPACECPPHHPSGISLAGAGTAVEGLCGASGTCVFQVSGRLGRGRASRGQPPSPFGQLA